MTASGQMLIKWEQNCLQVKLTCSTALKKQVLPRLLSPCNGEKMTRVKYSMDQSAMSTIKCTSVNNTEEKLDILPWYHILLSQQDVISRNVCAFCDFYSNIIIWYITVRNDSKTNYLATQIRLIRHAKIVIILISTNICKINQLST